MWWLGQSQEARDSVRFSGGDIRTVLAELADYIAEHSRVQDVRPWGNASSFDMTIINSAYIRAGIPTPWHFTNERCFRTVRNMYPQVGYDIEKKGKNAHNALSDAVFQAEHLIAIKNRNKK